MEVNYHETDLEYAKRLLRSINTDAAITLIRLFTEHKNTSHLVDCHGQISPEGQTIVKGLDVGLFGLR